MQPRRRSSAIRNAFAQLGTAGEETSLRESQTSLAWRDRVRTCNHPVSLDRANRFAYRCVASMLCCQDYQSAAMSHDYFLKVGPAHTPARFCRITPCGAAGPRKSRARAAAREAAGSEPTAPAAATAFKRRAQRSTARYGSVTRDETTLRGSGRRPPRGRRNSSNRSWCVYEAWHARLAHIGRWRAHGPRADPQGGLRGPLQGYAG